jgi:hypothetical protein
LVCIFIPFGIFGTKRDEIIGGWKKNYIMRGFKICVLGKYNYSDKVKND